MVEATNYIYLAILICLQYLGLQHESYQINIDFTKVEDFERQASVTLDFEKIKDNQNQWMIISPNKKHEIPMTVVMDSVTVTDRAMTKVTKFNEIDFERLKRQQDTIFNKRQKAVAILIRKDKTIELNTLDDSFYKKVTLKVNE